MKKKSGEYFLLCTEGSEHLGPSEIVIGNLDKAIGKAKIHARISNELSISSQGRLLCRDILIADKSGKVIGKVKY